MRCKICGESLKIIHKGTRDRDDIDVLECVSCHTKQLSSFGVNDYSNGFMNEKLGMDIEEIKKRLHECEADDERRTEYIKNIGLDGSESILDFGCGFGGFISRIKQSVESVVGVELGTDERNYLIDRGFTCYKFLNELPRTSSFDYITLFHVFEHLENPADWLVLLNGFLKENGRIIIEVPNANDALLSLYGCKAFADFTYWSAHLFLYNVNSIKYLISKTKFLEIESIEQVQRYSLANHLHWLAVGKPGGHKIWSFLDCPDINRQYSMALEKREMCDTIIITLKKAK